MKSDTLHFIALDLDFYALKSLGEIYTGITLVCADAVKSPIKDQSILLGVSNSVHHIESFSQDFYRSVNNSLCPGGRFIGIKSQGLFSKLVILVLNFIPKKFIPYSIKEIHSERSLLNNWLSKTIELRLTESGIIRFNVKKFLFHKLYSFKKQSI